MDPSTDESQQRPIEADINEYKRFVTLHSCKENQQTEHFAVVSKVVGIERLRNYHDDLEEILKLKSPDTNQEDVISQWQQSTKESRKSQEELTEFKRFKKLHVYPEEADKKFISIVEAAGGKGLLID
ncbi:hypothetical protein PtB15_13B395 [Puccinia triticina]|nr:hypothetical protein PtB15_13B395 [Puccinia triticina]